MIRKSLLEELTKNSGYIVEKKVWTFLKESPDFSWKKCVLFPFPYTYYFSLLPVLRDFSS